MNIAQREEENIVKLAVSGRLDAVSAPDADKTFQQLFEKDTTKILINLDGLEYISSAGLRVLLVVAKRSQQKGGKVAICGLTDNVKEVFEISGFSSIFKIFSNEDEASAYLSA
jgi:anti-anti-sigma factor